MKMIDFNVAGHRAMCYCHYDSKNVFGLILQKYMKCLFLLLLCLMIWGYEKRKNNWSAWKHMIELFTFDMIYDDNMN